MVEKILLNNKEIYLDLFREERKNGLIEISIEFKVTSKEYHDIAMLLYEYSFDVHIPERDLIFRATIREYATSVTNLYIEGAVADYKLKLIEVAMQ